MSDHQNEIADRNVYILGAGFSFNAGAPLIHNFLDASRRLHDQPFSALDRIERGYFTNAFDFRRRVAQSREKVRIDLDDIEQLFGLVEVSQRLSTSTKETRDSIVYVIAKTLQLCIANAQSNRPKFSLPLEPATIEAVPVFLRTNSHTGSQGPELGGVDQYDYFMSLVCGLYDDPQKRKYRNDSIITFNYDLVCEHSLRRLNYEADYGLPETMRDERDKTVRPLCNLIKLHGSTNWGVCNSCTQRGVVLSEKATDSPEEFRRLRCACGGTFSPLLVPPSWDKGEYRKIMAPVWRRAVEALSNATRICIIGYSMPETDAFFKYLLTVALAENHRLYRLIVVDLINRSNDPTEGTGRIAVEEKYAALLDPVFYKRRFKFFGEGLYRFLISPQSREYLERGELLIKTHLR